MWNIFKGMLRQTMRDKLLWLGGGYLLLMMIPMLTDELGIHADGSNAAVMLMQFLCVLLPAINGVITARVCGADLRDKTANYELLFGKKRIQVYLGRFFAALTVSMCLTAVLFLLPTAFYTVKNGWGGSYSVGNALLHIGLIFPLVFRIICFFTALTFLCRNDIIPALLSLVGTFALILAAMLLKESDILLTWQSATTDLMNLLDFSNSTTGYFNGEDITVYKAFLTVGETVRLLLTSLGIGAGWLFAGLALFRRQDIS